MQALPRRKKNIKTPRIRLRLNIVKLPQPPVILHPSLQALEHSKSCFAQPRSRQVTFFLVPSISQFYCVNAYSKCAWCAPNWYKSNEKQQYPWKKVASRDIGWAEEDFYCSNPCKVGRKMTGGCGSFTMFILNRIRGVFIFSFRFCFACDITTQGSLYSFQQPAL